jgi:hypothetical protein
MTTMPPVCDRDSCADKPAEPALLLFAGTEALALLVIFRPAVDCKIRKCPVSSQHGLILTEALLDDREELRVYGVGRCLPDADAVDTRELGVLVLVDGDDL